MGESLSVVLPSTDLSNLSKNSGGTQDSDFLYGRSLLNLKLKEPSTEYLNQLYFDALVFTPEALRHLVAHVTVSHRGGWFD
jgi:hypothetical protein